MVQETRFQGGISLFPIPSPPKPPVHGGFGGAIPCSLDQVLGGKGLTTTAGLSGLGIGKLKPATN